MSAALQGNVAFDGRRISLREASQRIAAALEASPEAVDVRRITMNARNSAAHCYGSWLETPIFAKILLADPFPVSEPISHPGARLRDLAGIVRTRSDQVTVEWSAARRLAPHDGVARVPDVLAHSSDTLVWRLVEGENLDRIITGSARDSAKRGLATDALRAVGMWLRTVHDSSDAGATTIDLNECTRALELYPAASSHRGRARHTAATTILELAARKIAGSKVQVGRALTHGDLAPPNIICAAGTSAVTIVDFEHAQERALSHDVVVMTSWLRAKRLHPLIPATLTVALEDAFWDGYGDVSRELRIALVALASAWVFYEYLDQAWRRSAQQPVGKRALVAVYQRFFEDKLARDAFQAACREIEEL